MNLFFTAHVGTTTEPKINGDVPSSKFVDRLTSFPVVSTGLDVVKSNPMTATPLAVAKRTSLLVAAPMAPLASLSYFVLEPLIEPIMKRLDTVAHDSLSRLESTWPVIKEQPENIKAEAKYLAFLPLTKGKERRDYVASTYSAEYSSCGKGGIITTGSALICTLLIVWSDGLLRIKSMLDGGRGSKDVTVQSGT
ncbi:MAG: hypothetical protein Q9204_006740 [Flavoplaca sp. TL-2023a]